MMPSSTRTTRRTGEAEMATLILTSLFATVAVSVIGHAILDTWYDDEEEE